MADNFEKDNTMTDKQLVRFKVVRTEVWFPEYEVPSDLAEDDILEYIANECPDAVYDEMCNKDTLDTDIDVDLVEVVR